MASVLGNLLKARYNLSGPAADEAHIEWEQARDLIDETLQLLGFDITTLVLESDETYLNLLEKAEEMFDRDLLHR